MRKKRITKKSWGGNCPKLLLILFENIISKADELIGNAKEEINRFAKKKVDRFEEKFPNAKNERPGSIL